MNYFNLLYKALFGTSTRTLLAKQAKESAKLDKKQKAERSDVLKQNKAIYAAKVGVISDLSIQVADLAEEIELLKEYK